MRHLYSILFYLLSPLAVLRLFIRSRKNLDYRKRIAERFGYFKAPTLKAPIWMHTVSVGEFLAAQPFIDKLMAAYPDRSLVITTTTPTGSAQVQAKLGSSVFHMYAPFDVPCAVKRFLKRIKPTAALFMETEVWPNYQYYCEKQGINTVILNARLSEKSAQGYLRFSKLVRETMMRFSHVIAQFEADARRFVVLGLPESRLSVEGNMKFDVTLAPDVPQKAKALREQVGESRPVWVAASTHPGEEIIVLEAFSKIKASLPNSLLLLVPRHPDRAEEVLRLVREKGFDIARRSTHDTVSDSTSVYLGDTMGELFVFYAAADCAYVGGSLVKHGGHNMLEPALLGKAIVTGPHVFNFAGVADLFNSDDAMMTVRSASELASAVISLLQDEKARNLAGQKASAVLAKQAGSLDRQFKIVSRYL